MNKLLIGDCLTALKDLEDGCGQLIMTSPPYADSRKKHMVAYIPIIMLNGFCHGPKNF